MVYIYLVVESLEGLVPLVETVGSSGSPIVSHGLLSVLPRISW